MTHIRGLIFDMDGVLLDSEPFHLKAYQDLLKTFDIEFTAEENKPFIGRKDLDLAQHLVSHHKIPLAAHVFLDRKEEFMAKLIVEEAMPMPGVVKLLQRAKEISMPCAVA